MHAAAKQKAEAARQATKPRQKEEREAQERQGQRDRLRGQLMERQWAEERGDVGPRPGFKGKLQRLMEAHHLRYRLRLLQLCLLLTPTPKDDIKADLLEAESRLAEMEQLIEKLQRQKGRAERRALVSQGEAAAAQARALRSEEELAAARQSAEEAERQAGEWIRELSAKLVQYGLDDEVPETSDPAEDDGQPEGAAAVPWALVRRLQARLAQQAERMRGLRAEAGRAALRLSLAACTAAEALDEADRLRGLQGRCQQELSELQARVKEGEGREAALHADLEAVRKLVLEVQGQLGEAEAALALAEGERDSAEQRRDEVEEELAREKEARLAERRLAREEVERLLQQLARQANGPQWAAAAQGVKQGEKAPLETTSNDSTAAGAVPKHTRRVDASPDAGADSPPLGQQPGRISLPATPTHGNTFLRCSGRSSSSSKTANTKA